MRIILDTQIWLDALVFGQADAAALVEAPAPLERLASPAMLAEFTRVIARPVFRLESLERSRLAARQLERVHLLGEAPDSRLPCTDPADQMFIDLAVAHRVDWLISRDKALLRLRRQAWRRFGVRIGTVATLAAQTASRDGHRPDPGPPSSPL